MPDFEITAPDGRKFVVTAPDGAKPEEVLSYAQQQFAAPAAPAGRDPSTSSALGSYARGVVQSATLGLADEARAKIDQWRGLGDYDTNLAANREQFRADADLHPVASLGGQVAGGVGSALLAAPVAAAVAPVVGGTALAANATRLAAPVVGRVNALAQSLPAWVRGTGAVAGGGALQGAAGGFGEGEGGFANRAGNAGTGAAIGAVAAPALGAVIQGPRWLGERTWRALGFGNADEAAERQINRSLERGRVTLDEAETRLNAGGTAPLALVDAGSRNTVNLGATAANTPSEAMDVADRFVQGRRLGRPDRLTAAGDAAFGGGSGDDAARETARMRAEREVNAGPLYERAFNQRVPQTVQDHIDPLIQSPEGQQALNHAVTILEREGRAAYLRSGNHGDLFDPAAMGLTRAEDGGWMLEGRMQNMRLVDAVKRGMDEMLEQYRSPVTGKLVLGESGRALNDQRAAYVEYLRAHPHLQPYGRALDAWAGPSAQLDATAAGRKAFRTDRDVVAERMRGPADVQDAYRLGAGRDFSDRVSDPAKASGVARLLLEDSQHQARLNSLLGPSVRDDLNAVLRRETEMTAVERAVSPRAGSQTGRLGAGGEDMGHDPFGPTMTAAAQLLGGHWLGAAQTAARGAYRRLGQGINPATSDALANRLFETDPARRGQVILQLRNRLMADEAATAEARRTLRPVMRGFGGGASQGLND